MYEQDIFREITYSGYNSSEPEATDDELISADSVYTFDVTFVMEPNLTPAEEEAIRIAEEEAAALAEAAGEANPENNEEVTA
jgi:hypothetical protein